MARRHWLYAGLGVTAVLAGSAWLAWSRSDLGMFANSLSHNLSEARRSGIALTAAELRQKYQASDVENAAPIYTKAIAGMRSSGVSQKEIDRLKASLNDGLPRADEAPAKQTVHQLGPVLALLDRASKKPHVDFRRKWELGPAVMFPEFADLKRLAGVLLLRAETRSRDGRPLEALADVSTAAKLGKHSGEEPTIIAKLVQLAIYNQCAVRLEAVVNRHPKAEVLDQAAALIEVMDAPDIRSALDGEATFMRICFQIIARDSAALQGFGAGPEWELLRFASVRRGAESKVIHELTELHRKLPDDPNNFYQAQSALTEMDRRMAADDIQSKLAGLLLPVFAPTGDAIAMWEARRMVARGAIKLFREHPGGDFPGKLPFHSKDPFASGPLTYSRTAKGFTLYSLGRDRTDDGGARTSNGSSSNRDLVWIYER